MEDQQVYQKVNDLLSATADRLDEQDVTSCQQDLHAGEVGIAIDTIVGAIVEDEILISRHEYELIAEILNGLSALTKIHAVEHRDKILRSLHVRHISAS